MDLSKNFKTDSVKEVEGSWETIDIDTEVLVARTNNTSFDKAYNKIPRGIRRMIENGTLAGKQVDTIICDIMSKTILLDWKGIEFEGEKLKYSTENANKVLIALPEFREFIWQLATDFQRFHDGSVEKDAKKSTSASDGK